ncbi:MAG: hypothetical protein D3916_10925 [Candidatus Electrothrix sp. MAN1_4]|nr:hypothetical protein [Candidatus Electrothrix sp. MAN1_4]
MSSDKIGRQLHDKATRGKALTSEEHEVLEKWYARHDNAESELLNRDHEPQAEHILHKQIDPILTRIGTTAEQIHNLTDENRMLKKNISKLQRQLAEKNSALSV